MTTKPVNGTVAVSGASVTYTPTVAARLAAGSTTGVDFDSFTVAVSDGQASTPVSVSVPVLPAVWVNAPQVSNVTGASPYGVALVGNTAYVANQGTNTVSVINTLTGQTVRSPIVVGSAPTGVVASPDGVYVYVANRTSGTVSVIRTSNNTVVDINPGTTAIDSIKVGSQPEMIAVNTSAITTPTGVIAKGARLYVANYGSGTVSVIDVSNPLAPKLVDTNTATPTTVDAIKVGTNPRGIAFAQTANGPRLYVVNRGSGNVSVIDAVTNKVIDANPATATTVDAIKVGSTPQQIAISPDGKSAYVTNYGSNTVSIIDTVTNKVVDANPATTAVDAIAVRSNPDGVAVSADGSLVYVANGDDRISVIDTKTKTVVNTLRIDTQSETNFSHHGGACRWQLDGHGSGRPGAASGDLPTRQHRTGGPGSTHGGANPNTGWRGHRIGQRQGLRRGSADLHHGSGPTRGSVSFDPAAGTYTYTPTQAARDAAAQNPGLTDTFTIRATEQPTGASVTTTPITVTVLPTPVSNRAPVSDGNFYFPASDDVTGIVIGSVGVSDPDGDALDFRLVSGPWYGALDLDSSTGAFVYTPSYQWRVEKTLWADYFTDDLMTFTVSDGQATIYKDISVELAPLHGPQASPAVYSVDPATGTVTGSMYAVDYDGDPLSYAVTSVPAHGGTVSIDAAGTFTYAPDQADRGVLSTDTFTVAVTGGQETISVPVTVPVRPLEVAASKTPIPLGAWPDFLATKDSKVYVLNAGESTISVIDTDTNTVVATSGQLPAGGAMALSPNGTRLYVADYLGTHVYVLDSQNLAQAGAPINVVTTYGGTLAVSPDGKRLYVGSVTPNPNGYGYSAGYVSVVDTVARSVIAEIPVNSSSVGNVAITPDGNLLYVNDPTGVHVVDIATRSRIAFIDVGGKQADVAFSADGSRAYITNFSNGLLHVIDTETNAVVAKPTVDIAPWTSGAYEYDSPTGLAVSPTDGRIYVADGDDVVVVDPVTHGVIGEIRAATQMPNNGAQSLTISSNGAYVTLEDTVVALEVDPLTTSVYAVTVADESMTGSALTGESAQSSLMLASVDIETIGGQSMMAAAAATTTSASGPTVNAPDHVTGEVTGLLNVGNLDGNSSTTPVYTVTGQPASGSVSVDVAGNFSYKPRSALALGRRPDCRAGFRQFHRGRQRWAGRRDCQCDGADFLGEARGWDAGHCR